MHRAFVGLGNCVIAQIYAIITYQILAIQKNKQWFKIKETSQIFSLFKNKKQNKKKYKKRREKKVKKYPSNNHSTIKSAINSSKGIPV